MREESCAAVVEELRRTARRLRHQQQRLGRDHVADAALLGAVDAAGALRPADLAGTLLVDASVVSRQVSALVADGLLRREPDPADGRSRLLHVTPAGAAALAERRAVGCAVLGERLADWEDDDVAALARLLHRFNDALDDDGPHATSHHHTAHAGTTAGGPTR